MAKGDGFKQKEKATFLYAESTDEKNKKETDWQRDEAEPYQELVQRIRATCRNRNPSKRTILSLFLFFPPAPCLQFLDSLYPGREQRESTQQTENTRTDCYERQMQRRRGKGDQIRERERDRWNGWRKNCQEGEGDREEGGGGDERMDVREEVGVGEKYG
jgi:hypothetical protein